jgi:predicted metal-dependent hydrolase
MTYVKSNVDNIDYLVRNTSDKQQAANTLARIRQNAIILSDYLFEHINDKKIAKYKQYVTRLHEKIRDVIIVESTQDSIYTSYSVNKGEQIVFCLRSRKNYNNLHDVNLMMYVVLHEISHVACPIYDNHGPLFREIFGFITEHAIAINIYKKIDFLTKPEEYCGMMITDSII